MSKYPEKEILKAAEVREELFKYAKSRGVKPYLMNYLTGSATPTIAKNFPEIIGELDKDNTDHHGAMSYCHANDGLKKIRRQENIIYIDGPKPFNFSRNMNLGAEAALKKDKDTDIVFMNDDTQVLSLKFFEELQKALYSQRFVRH